MFAKVDKRGVGSWRPLSQSPIKIVGRVGAVDRGGKPVGEINLVDIASSNVILGGNDHFAELFAIHFAFEGDRGGTCGVGDMVSMAG